MAAKLEKLKKLNAKDREDLEAKKKEHEELMIKRNLFTAKKIGSSNVSNNNINNTAIGDLNNVNNTNPSENVTNVANELGTNEASNNFHRKSINRKTISNRGSFVNKSGTSTNSVSNDTNDVLTIEQAKNLLNSIIPSSKRVSDWVYTGSLDSNPPVIKGQSLYDNLRLLGRGAFGEVNLVKNTDDNQL